MTAKRIAKQIIACFERGNKCIIFGNGGSLADASHFAAEFNGIRPVIALNDSVKITSIANDHGFEWIFGYQLRDLGKEGDLVIALTTSEKPIITKKHSENIWIAMAFARNIHMEFIDFPRKGKTTQEIQEYQYHLLHDIYLEVKKQL